MRRISVIPEQLEALGGQLRAAAGDLQAAESTVRRGMSALDWEVRSQADIEQQMAEAHARAAALSTMAEQMGRFVQVKAGAFRRADQAGVEDLQPWTDKWQPPQPLPAAASAGDLVLEGVPLLKQSGQPWSDIVFKGEKTWADWGCTLTSMVMALKCVDPSITVDRAFMLRFKQHVVGADGLVYWDSPGTKAILLEHGAGLQIQWPGGDAKQAMQMALANLKKGLPSIIGVDGPKRSHWVTITGFTGDPANPKPEDFLIKDPGANRTTLQQLFADYADCPVDKLVTIAKVG